MTPKKFVTVVGNIGSGKTTLSRLVASEWGWKPWFEVVNDNPYLADFYGDMAAWSFQLQLFFLSKRFEHHMSIVESSQSAIQDRSIYEDGEIFARSLLRHGNMTERDYQSYRDLFDQMTGLLPAPDLIVYLEAQVETVQTRIRQRGRPFEQSIPDAYLHDLQEFYEDWLGRWNRSAILTLPSDDLDLVNTPGDISAVLREIRKALHQSPVAIG